MTPPKDPQADKRMTLRMPVSLWRRLRIAAAKQDTSVTELITRLCAEGVTRLEAADRPA